jgi:hypothetical protein
MQWTPKISLEDLHTRLLYVVQNRINNGDFSERSLARTIGISQPQMHNVLKRARKLTPEVGDRMMSCFGIGILDLFETGELAAEVNARLGPAPTMPVSSPPRKPAATERFKTSKESEAA